MADVTKVLPYEHNILLSIFSTIFDAMFLIVILEHVWYPFKWFFLPHKNPFFYFNFHSLLFSPFIFLCFLEKNIIFCAICFLWLSWWFFYFSFSYFVNVSNSKQEIFASIWSHLNFRVQFDSDFLTLIPCLLFRWWFLFACVNRSFFFVFPCYRHLFSLIRDLSFLIFCSRLLIEFWFLHWLLFLSLFQDLWIDFEYVFEFLSSICCFYLDLILILLHTVC